MTDIKSSVKVKYLDSIKSTLDKLSSHNKADYCFKNIDYFPRSMFVSLARETLERLPSFEI